ncbi:phosphate ABC transporter substrate-binding/OmpA family protein [Citreimonas salinaria]|uniref:Phosphate ABC transporter substrate-binding protein, PhoT family n=1 Tax=Citreimonas salinaria TaxID=321339 RepID=A0A1H3EXU6_9RHOB|nr:phosphate ABC transporter substrate-binding/OmpA family protein [Citreimonas salinaria]SDX82908.1 phosphate ABC transporter substrate-binding protein, PhoT family [Citreimonas salinaria]
MRINRCAAFCAALFLSVTALAARAQDVALRSRDGAIEVAGTLLGFDGQYYRVQTRYGELTVDGSGVVCEGVGCPSLTNYVAELEIAGSKTVGSVLVPALIEGFALSEGLIAERETAGGDVVYVLSRPKGAASAQSGIVGRFTVRATTTDEGFADLLADEADIAMALREITAAEVALAREAGLGDLTQPNRSVVLALDAIVPVVASRNPVDAVSMRDLARILSGDITNWSELGGPDVAIAVHLREVGSGLAHGVARRLLEPARATLREEVIRHADNAALARAVERDPFGIGFASFSTTDDAKPLVLTGSCGFQLRAARRTIKTEDYPLTTPMFLYLPARRLPALGRDFLAYARSEAAQVVIRRAGFVDRAAEEVPVDLQGDRLANAILAARTPADLAELRRLADRLSGWRRLTTSFRFEPGSARLDAQSRANVRALADALEAGEHDGQGLAFVGFSDGRGAAPVNLEIARKRAEAVRAAVLEAAETADLGRVEIDTEAFGEALPLACDDSAWGRQINRRVEVWVR